MNTQNTTPIRNAARTIDELRTRVQGEVILPGDESYETTRHGANLLYNRFPSVIVRASRSEDVAETVTFARANGIPFSVRCGGHSVGGFSVVDGAVLIDLAGMTGVEIDPVRQVAKVQGGARSYDLAIPAHEHGLALSTGDTGTVGLGGLVTGGGVGWFVRKYGIAADRLLSAKLVLADGSVVTASALQNSDLFWAIRGGGGNFGVIVEFEFKLVPVKHVYGGAIILPATREVVRGYLEYSATAPDELTTMATITHAPPAPFIPEDRLGERVLLVLAAWIGDAAEGPEAMAPLRALAEPIADTVETVPYPVMFQYMQFAEAPHGGRVKMMFTNEVPDETIDGWIEAVDNAPSPMAGIHLRGLGGQLARIPADSNAFVHRDKKYFVSVLGLWDETVTDEAPHVAWADETWERMKHLSEGVYVNFIGDEGEARVREAYAKGTYERLAQVKAKYDPDNVFRFNQNVRPATPDSQRKAA